MMLQLSEAAAAASGGEPPPTAAGRSNCCCCSTPSALPPRLPAASARLLTLLLCFPRGPSSAGTLRPPPQLPPGSRAGPGGAEGAGAMASLKQRWPFSSRAMTWHPSATSSSLSACVREERLLKIADALRTQRTT